MASFTNQATLSYNNIIRNSNKAEGELLEVLTATKEAVMNDYVAGDDVTYVISIRNTGSKDFIGLSITDDLGGYTFGGGTVYPMDYVTGSIRYYINGLKATAPTPTAGPPLKIDGISVPAGGNVLIMYETSVNEYAPLGLDSTIANIATIEGGGLNTPLKPRATIGTENIPDLSISKSLNPATVAENGTITYTFILLNSGNTAAEAGDHVIITDTFDPRLTITSVRFDNSTTTVDWAENTDYTYSGEGVFTSVDGRITVPAATYKQNTSGAWVTDPGVAVLTVTGTV